MMMLHQQLIAVHQLYCHMVLLQMNDCHLVEAYVSELQIMNYCIASLWHILLTSNTTSSSQFYPWLCNLDGVVHLQKTRDCSWNWHAFLQRNYHTVNGVSLVKTQPRMEMKCGCFLQAHNLIEMVIGRMQHLTVCQVTKCKWSWGWITTTLHYLHATWWWWSFGRPLCCCWGFYAIACFATMASYIMGAAYELDRVTVLTHWYNPLLWEWWYASRHQRGRML